MTRKKFAGNYKPPEGGSEPSRPTEIVLNRPPVLFRLFSTNPYLTGVLSPFAVDTGVRYQIGQWYTSKCWSYPDYLRREYTDHSAPSLDCACGFYAYFDPLALAHDLAEFHDNDAMYLADLDCVVIGTVEVAGRVILHEHGVRAEAMRPLKTWKISRDPNSMRVPFSACCGLARAWHRTFGGNPQPGADETMAAYTVKMNMKAEERRMMRAILEWKDSLSAKVVDQILQSGGSWYRDSNGNYIVDP